MRTSEFSLFTFFRTKKIFKLHFKKKTNLFFSSY